MVRINITITVVTSSASIIIPFMMYLDNFITFISALVDILQFAILFDCASHQK